MFTIATNVQVDKNVMKVAHWKTLTVIIKAQTPTPTQCVHLLTTFTTFFSICK